MKWANELERAAKDHCNDLGTSGQMSSIGSGKQLVLDADHRDNLEFSPEI